MPQLVSYCIPYDDGAAPNPFWGICTLVICRPVIRRTADIGDWIVATGSMNSPQGDISGQVVYAMRITDKMSMEKYDHHTKRELRGKVPEWLSPDPRVRVGDSIYDFERSPPSLRPSVHSESNRERDLGGLCALLSSDFYYFGKSAVPLPAELRPIVKQGQGHRSRSNAPYLIAFVEWIRTQKPGVNGEPQMWKWGALGDCGSCRAHDDEEDERIGCAD